MELTKLALLYALLSAYCLDGCLMEHFTLFYAWTLTTTSQDLARIQTATGKRAMYIYVVPKILVTLLPAYLVFSSDALFTSRGSLWMSLAFLGVSWASSFLVQVRLQLRIQESKGTDRVALERLVRTTWVRTLAMVGHCAVVGYGVYAA